MNDPLREAEDVLSLYAKLDAGKRRRRATLQDFYERDVEKSRKVTLSHIFR